MKDTCYYTEDEEYRYPDIDGKLPKAFEYVHLITYDGTRIQGFWPHPEAMGWAPYHKRNKAIELALKAKRDAIDKQLGSK
jgi:hypothetical protein